MPKPLNYRKRLMSLREQSARAWSSNHMNKPHLRYALSQKGKATHKLMLFAMEHVQRTLLAMRVTIRSFTREMRLSCVCVMQAPAIIGVWIVSNAVMRFSWPRSHYFRLLFAG